MKRWILMLMVLLLAGVACEDEPTGCDDCGDWPPPPTFQNLSQKWHVLNNFESSYNKRRYDKYDQLLDVNFTFFFDEGDVGGAIPDQWGRSEELEATSRLFDANLDDPNYYRCKSIQMEIMDEREAAWVEIPAPEGFPGETWYSTVVFYDFQFELEPDLTLIPFLGSKAKFVVRNAGTEDAPRWGLVEMHDLGASNLASAARRGVASTLGSVKSLYQ